MRVDSIYRWGVEVANRSNFEYLNPAFNKARTQRKLADVILEHFLMLRELLEEQNPLNKLLSQAEPLVLVENVSCDSFPYQSHSWWYRSH